MTTRKCYIISLVHIVFLLESAMLDGRVFFIPNSNHPCFYFYCHQSDFENDASLCNLSSFFLNMQPCVLVSRQRALTLPQVSKYTADLRTFVVLTHSECAASDGSNCIISRRQSTANVFLQLLLSCSVLQCERNNCGKGYKND